MSPSRIGREHGRHEEVRTRMTRPITRREFLGGAALVAAGTAVEACLPAGQGVQSSPSVATPSSDPSVSPDSGAPIVLRGATVLTMDPNRPEAEAITIAGETIAAVGSEADALAAAGPSATIVDLAGGVVLPGFNDAHCHRIGDRDVGGYESIEAAIDDALAGGWTSISELFVNQERLDELRALDDSDGLRVRVNCYFPVNYENQQFGIWFGDYRPRQEFSSRLRVGGVKVFADSAWTNKMYMTEPHVDQPGYRGDVFWTPDDLTALYRSLHDDGWSLATHTCGDAAHDMVLDAYEAALAGADNAQLRHRIDHLMAVRDDQVQRMRDLSILASFQLTWFTSGTTPDVESTLGEERLPWVGRWHDLLAAGVPAVASTDYPWVDLAERDNTSGYAMKALSIAATRSSGPGDVPQDWQAAQAITVDQGLELMTRAGAYATFEEDRKGTLATGKLADLVVLDADPRRVASEDLAGVNVVLTMVGGSVAYRSSGA
jgi:predicted amidohydrolase YtcJ